MGNEIGAQGEDNGQTAVFPPRRFCQQFNKRGAIFFFGLGEGLLKLVYQKHAALTRIIAQQRLNLFM